MADTAVPSPPADLLEWPDLPIPPTDHPGESANPDTNFSHSLYLPNTSLFPSYVDDQWITTFTEGDGLAFDDTRPPSSEQPQFSDDMSLSYDIAVPLPDIEMEVMERNLSALPKPAQTNREISYTKQRSVQGQVLQQPMDSLSTARDVTPARIRELHCPIFEGDKVLDRPHSCHDIAVVNMSAVRHHLKSHSEPQVPRLKYCRTCNGHFTDRTHFENYHGNKCHGELHNGERRRSRGKGQEEQWRDVYQLLNPTIGLQLNVHSTYDDAQEPIPVPPPAAMTDSHPRKFPTEHQVLVVPESDSAEASHDAYPNETNLS